MNQTLEKNQNNSDSQALKNTKKQDILLYTDCPGIYGAGQWNHALMCGLVASGYKVSCAQSKVSDHLIDEREKLGIKHFWLLDDDIYHPTKPVRAFTNISEAEDIFSQALPDLIIFGNGCPVSNLAAQQVASKMGIPYITVVHCVTSHWVKQFAAYLDYLPDIYKHTGEFITVSHENLELLRKLFKLPQNQGRVIYNGRPAQYFDAPNLEIRQHLRQDLGIPNDAIVCFTAARMEFVKGYQYQLNAIHQLQKSDIWEKLYFIWAGTGTSLVRFKTIASLSGLNERIKFLGESPDIPDLLDAADIFILPSNFEGMPLAIMEAMAKGIPVISTAVSGIPEELGDTGKLLPDPNVSSQATIKELATTIESWTKDSKLRKSIGESCKNRAEKMFQEERMIKDYVEIIECSLSAFA